MYDEFIKAYEFDVKGKKVLVALFRNINSCKEWLEIDHDDVVSEICLNSIEWDGNVAFYVSNSSDLNSDGFEMYWESNIENQSAYVCIDYKKQRYLTLKEFLEFCSSADVGTCKQKKAAQ